MCASLYGPRIERVFLYDLAGIEPDSIPEEWRSRTHLSSGWEEVYKNSEIVFTCTASDQRYIDKPPAPGMLLMDISLRDYRLEAFLSIPAVIVDDWDEVCRENTDIEMLHLKRGLRRDQTLTLADVVCRDALRQVPSGQSILFCPMGMAVFDIAVAQYLANLACEAGAGVKI
jgi:ornithine cyclodeaminase